MDWWVWVIVGLVLLGAEVAAPGGIVMLFFGAAAIVVGALTAFGLGPAWLQFVLFSILSVVSLLLLREPILRRMSRRHGDSDDIDSLIGTTAILTHDLEPGGTGKAELRGTTWSAHNADTDPLTAGQVCLVERVEGLTLFLRGKP